MYCIDGATPDIGTGSCGGSGTIALTTQFLDDPDDVYTFGTPYTLTCDFCGELCEYSTWYGFIDTVYLPYAKANDMCSNSYDNISGMDDEFIVVHKGNTCTVYDSDDGSVVVQIPDDGTLSSYDVFKCEAVKKKIFIWTTNGTDTIFVYYEGTEDEEWYNDTVTGYVANDEKYANNGYDVLLSATNENGEAYIYYYISGGISTFGYGDCLHCYFIDGYHLFRVNSSGNWEFLNTDDDLADLAPVDTNIAYSDHPQIWGKWDD